MWWSIQAFCLDIRKKTQGEKNSKLKEITENSATWLWSLPWMPPKFSGIGRQGLQRCWHTFYQCLYLIGLCCLLLSHECPQISTDRRSQTLLPDLQVLIYSIFSRLMSYKLTLLFYFFQSIKHYLWFLDCAAINVLQSRTFSILSLLLCCRLHWLSFFLSLS